jgi:cyclophilin family peptidyl-prolyl cis-trans isomerase
VLAQLEVEFPEDIRLVYRHFPLASIHDKALLATQAAEAAGRQGMFWEMHDFLFNTQAEWSAITGEEFQTWLIQQALELGLDLTQFEADLVDPENVAFAQQTWEFGQEIQLRGTPFILINDAPYGGLLDLDSLRSIIKLLILEERQYDECPPLIIDPLKDYSATIQTEKGDILIRLFAEDAPLAVNSFVFLAQEGWFDGITFHRVLPGFVAQGGDPSGTGFGGPGYSFDNEIDAAMQFDKSGLVAMANAGPGTNGSQFFITFDEQEDLNYDFTIFGEVVTGMEVAETLTPRNPQPGVPLPDGDRIITITIEER